MISVRCSLRVWVKAILLAAAVAPVIAASPARAAINEWKATAPDSWNTGSNWTTGMVPNILDIAYIGNGGTALIGDGQSVFAGYPYLGYRSSAPSLGGAVVQTGGTNDTVYLQMYTLAGQTASYTISNGLFQTWNMSLQSHDGAPFSGDVSFNQTGGTVKIAGYTHPFITTDTAFNAYMNLVAADTGAPRTLYRLSGGQLIGAQISMFGKSVFAETGGSAALGGLNVGSGATYQLAAGSLSIRRGLDLDGALDFTSVDSSIKTINASGLINLTHASTLGASQGNLIADAKSLVILPAGVTGATLFGGGYSNAGLEATAGAPILVPAGRDIEAWGQFDDRVTVSGKLRATPLIGSPFFGEPGRLAFNAGVFVTGDGVVDTGVVNSSQFSPNLNGVVHVNDALSGIDGGSLKSWIEFIGTTGAGTFTQSGGVNTVASLLLSSNYSLAGYLNTTPANGTYNLTGGTLNVNYMAGASMEVGDGGTGAFNQSGGVSNVNSLEVGRSNRNGALLPNGTVTLSAGKLNATDATFGVGSGSVASFQQTGGNFAVKGGSLRFADGSNSIATASIQGGSVKVTGYVVVGRGGNATITQSGGTVSSTLHVAVASDKAGTTQQYVMPADSTGALSIGTELVVSGFGSASFQQAGGAVTAGSVRLGGNYTGLNIRTSTSNSTKGDYTLTGGTLTAPVQTIGRFGSGVFTQSGGTNTAATSLSIASGDSVQPGSGSYLLQGTGVLNAGNLIVGAQGTGSFTQSGSSQLHVTDTLTVGAEATAIGTVNLNGNGAKSVSRFIVSDASTLNIAPSSTLQLTHDWRPGAAPNPNDSTAALASLNFNGTGMLDVNTSGVQLRVTTLAAVVGLLDPAIKSGGSGNIISSAVTSRTSIGTRDLGGGTVLARHTLKGDADIDGDVDTQDITVAIGRFNGAGATGRIWADGDSDYDGDVDTQDITVAIGGFTSVLASRSAISSMQRDEAAAGPLGGAPAGSPALIYNAATGEVLLHADGINVLAFYIKSNDAFINTSLISFAQFEADTLSLMSAATDRVPSQIGWVSPLQSANMGYQGLNYDLAGFGLPILPSGLSESEFAGAITAQGWAGPEGTSGQFDLSYVSSVPEPSTLILLTLGSLLAARRRR